MILNFDRGYGQDNERMIQSLMESTQMALDTMERKLKAAGVDITEGNEGKSTSIVDLVYPVGAIYMSVSNVSPTKLFGGTWKRIGVGRTLISARGEDSDGTDSTTDSNDFTDYGTYDPTALADGVFTAGQTGGTAEYAITEEQMPVHTHIQNAHHHAGLRSASVSGTQVKGGSDYCSAGTRSGLGSHSSAKNVIYTVNTTATNKNAGGGLAHTNMPPYLAVYMWKRTE